MSWAQSKVDRFEEKITGSNLGPGDYDPCLPRSQGMAGAVSLGFTSTKGMTPLDREQNNPATTEEVLSLPAPTSKQPTTTCGFGRPRPALNVGASRLEKVKAEQQEKQLVRLEMEREKLQDEVKTLRSLQVCTAVMYMRETRALERRERRWMEEDVPLAWDVGHIVCLRLECLCLVGLKCVMPLAMWVVMFRGGMLPAI